MDGFLDAGSAGIHLHLLLLEQWADYKIISICICMLWFIDLSVVMAKFFVYLASCKFSKSIFCEHWHLSIYRVLDFCNFSIHYSFHLRFFKQNFVPVAVQINISINTFKKCIFFRIQRFSRENPKKNSN